MGLTLKKIKNVLGLDVPADLKRLQARTEASCKTLAGVLLKSRAQDTALDETPWFERIEARRSVVYAKTDQVRILDFGSERTDDSISKGQMEAGREKMLIVGEHAKHSSKKPKWAAVLFNLIRGFKFKSCLELGTCMGISASYESAALKLNRQGGKLYTLDAVDAFQGVARDGFAQMGLSEHVQTVLGRFSDALPGVLPLGPFDYAFIDGHHDEFATVQYFDQIHPHLTSRALVVFDDIGWSDGMRRAWDKIRRDPRISLTVGMGGMGLALIDPEIEGHPHFDIGLD